MVDLPLSQPWPGGGEGLRTGGSRPKADDQPVPQGAGCGSKRLLGFDRISASRQKQRLPFRNTELP